MLACGNCLLETKLLQEDAEGKAVPANGGYFSDDFLAKAEEIVAGCPVQALSIAEGEGTDLSKLPEKLQNALAKITVPKVSRGRCQNARTGLPYDLFLSARRISL